MAAKISKMQSTRYSFSNALKVKVYKGKSRSFTNIELSKRKIRRVWQSIININMEHSIKAIFKFRSQPLTSEESGWRWHCVASWVVCYTFYVIILNRFIRLTCNRVDILFLFTKLNFETNFCIQKLWKIFKIFYNF